MVVGPVQETEFRLDVQVACHAAEAEWRICKRAVGLAYKVASPCASRRGIGCRREQTELRFSRQGDRFIFSPKLLTSRRLARRSE